MYESNGFSRQVSALPQDPFLRPGSDRVRVLGHRGAPATARPDNSVAAVTEALLQGADGVEVDIRLTADGTLVCAHDLSPAPPSRLPSRRCPSCSPPCSSSAGAQVVVEAKPVTDAAVAARTASVLADVLRTFAGNAAITVSSFDRALLAMIRADVRRPAGPHRAARRHRRPRPPRSCGGPPRTGTTRCTFSLAGVRRTPEVGGDGAPAWACRSRSGRSTTAADLQWVAELGVDAVITDDILTAWSELDRATMIREMVAA